MSHSRISPKNHSPIMNAPNPHFQDPNPPIKNSLQNINHRISDSANHHPDSISLNQKPKSPSKASTDCPNKEKSESFLDYKAIRGNIPNFDKMYSKSLNSKFRTLDKLESLFQTFLMENAPDDFFKDIPAIENPEMNIDSKQKSLKEKNLTMKEENHQTLTHSNLNTSQNDQDEKHMKFKNIIKDYFNKNSKFPCFQTEFIIDLTEDHSDRITAMHLLDNETLVTGGLDSTIRVWDTKSGEQTMLLRGHSKRISALASPSGKDILFSASFDCSIKVWDLKQKKEAFTREDAHPAEIRALAILIDDANFYLISGGENKCLVVWVWSKKMDKTQETHELDRIREITTYDVIHCIITIHQRKMTISAGKSPIIQVFGPPNEVLSPNEQTQNHCFNPITGLIGHQKEIAGLAISFDEKWLVSGSEDKTVRVWCLVDFTQILHCDQYSGGILGVLFLSSDNEPTIIASYDRNDEIKYFDFYEKPEKMENNLEKSKKIETVPNKLLNLKQKLSHYRNLLLWNPNSKCLYRTDGKNVKEVSITDKNEKIFNHKDKNKTISNPTTYSDNTQENRNTLNMKKNVSEFENNESISLEKRNTMMTETAEKDHFGSVLLFTQDSRQLIFTYLKTSIYRQDLDSKSSPKKPKILNSTHTCAINSLVLANVESRLISGDIEGKLEILDLKTDQILKIICKDYDKGLLEGKMDNIIFATKTKTISYFNMNNLKKTENDEQNPNRISWPYPECISFDGQPHKEKINCLTGANNFGTIISGSDDGMIILWDFSSRRRIAFLEGHLSRVTSIFVNYEKNLLFSTSEKECISWDLKSDQKNFRIELEIGNIIATNSKILLKQNKDQKNIEIIEINEINPEKVKVIAFLERDPANLESLALSPNNNAIVASFANDTIYVWEINKPKTLELEQAHLGPVSFLKVLSKNELASFGKDDIIRIWDLEKKCLKNEIPMKDVSCMQNNEKKKTELIIARNSIMEKINLDTGGVEGKSIEIGRKKGIINHIEVFDNFIISSGHSGEYGSIRFWEYDENTRNYESVFENNEAHHEEVKNLKLLHGKGIKRLISTGVDGAKAWKFDANKLESYTLIEKEIKGKSSKFDDNKQESYTLNEKDIKGKSYDLIRVDNEKLRVMVNDGKDLKIWLFNEQGEFSKEKDWIMESGEIKDFAMNLDKVLIVIGQDQKLNVLKGSIETRALEKIEIGEDIKNLTCFHIDSIHWRLIVGNSLGRIMVWNFEESIIDKEKNKDFELKTTNLKYKIISMALSPKKKKILTFCNFYCMIWDINTKKKLQVIEETEYNCHAMSLDESFLIIGTTSGWVKFWNMKDWNMKDLTLEPSYKIFNHKIMNIFYVSENEVLIENTGIEKDKHQNNLILLNKKNELTHCKNPQNDKTNLDQLGQFQKRPQDIEIYLSTSNFQNFDNKRNSENRDEKFLLHDENPKKNQSKLLKNKNKCKIYPDGLPINPWCIVDTIEIESIVPLFAEKKVFILFKNKEHLNFQIFDLNLGELEYIENKKDAKDYYSALLLNQKNNQIITGSKNGVISIRDLKKTLENPNQDSHIIYLYGHNYPVVFLKVFPNKNYKINEMGKEKRKNNENYKINEMGKEKRKNNYKINEMDEEKRKNKVFSMSENIENLDLTLRIWDLDLMVCCMVIKECKTIFRKIELLPSKSGKSLAFDGRNIIDFKNEYIISNINRDLPIKDFFLNDNNEIIYQLKAGDNDFEVLIVPILNFLGASKNFFGFKNGLKEIELSMNKNYSITPFEFNLLHVFALFENLQQKGLDLLDYQSFLKLKLSLQPFLSIDFEGKTCFDYLLMNNKIIALKSLFQIFFTAMQNNITPFFNNNFYLKTKFFRYEFSSQFNGGFLEFLKKLIELFQEDTQILDKIFEYSFVPLESSYYKRLTLDIDLKEPIFMTTDDFGWLTNEQEVNLKIKEKLRKRGCLSFLTRFFNIDEFKTEVKKSKHKCELICSVILMKGILDITDTTCDIWDLILDLDTSNRIFNNKVLGMVIQHKWHSYAKNDYIKEAIQYLCSFVIYITNFVYIYPQRQDETDGDYYVKVSMILEIITLVFFVLYSKEEIKQIYWNGWKKYFSFFWNWIDICVILGTFSSLILDLISMKVNMIPYPLKLLVAITLLFLWARMLSYSRGIKGSGFLIRLVGQVIIDIRYFVIMIFLAVLAFASSGYVLQIDYVFSQYFFFNIFYRLMLNDFGGYDVAVAPEDGTPLWLLMIIITLVLSIIMLNLLISIIGGTYANVFESRNSMRNIELFNVIQEIDKFKILKRKEYDSLKKKGILGNYLICFHTNSQFAQEEQKEDHILKDVHALEEKLDVNSRQIDDAFRNIEEIKKSFELNSFKTNQTLEEIKMLLQGLTKEKD